MAGKPQLPPEEAAARAAYRRTYKYKKENGHVDACLVANDNLRIRNRQYVWDYLKIHPCISCGEADPMVLEFDHREQQGKASEISNMVNRAFSIANLQLEMDKCDVLCANCHRRRTVEQLGWHLTINR